MNQTRFQYFRNAFCLSLLALLSATAFAAEKQENDAVNRLIDRIAANERELLAAMRDYEPLLETYIQMLGPDGQSPAGDEYMIGRLHAGAEGISQDVFSFSEGFRRRSSFWFFKFNTPGLVPEGFAQMIAMDTQEFGRSRYRFEYVRQEFLGAVRCLVFDVAPRNRSEPGRFIGRIWVEDRGFHIVRFNGRYTQGKGEAVYFHFDSWRVNVAPGFWAPAYVYVEDASSILSKGKREVHFRAQTRIWGYNTGRRSRLQELTQVLVESGGGVRDEAQPRDPTPVESMRSWERQAERNVLDRLERSGLLARPGPVDEVLRTVVGNLMAANGLSLDVECRVLLTTPLETFTIGQAIVISRGLIDVLPGEASLAMALSGELAHIVLGHRTETMLAFSDLTMLNDKELLAELRMERTGEEQQAASRKALELLRNSPYTGKLEKAGLFLKALLANASNLTNLIEPNLGNELARGGGLVRLAELAAEAPELQQESVEQIAALPLGSRIKLDPWTNRIQLTETGPLELRSARDKMPFQVTPFLIHLTRAPEHTAAQETPADSGGG